MAEHEYDVAVIGGGTAGAFAGIAAAASGARTVIIEQYGYLGGILSLGMNLLGSADGEGYWALGGYPRDVVRELIKDGHATPPVVDSLFGSILAQDPEPFKVYLLRKAREKGVQLLFHTMLVDAETDGGRVTDLTVANKSGLMTIKANCVVDATGDADLVARAGGEFAYGNGSTDKVTQPVSNIFRVGGVELDGLWNYLEDHPEDRTVPTGWSGEPYSMDYIRSTPGVHLMAFQNLVKRAKDAGDVTIPRNRLGIYTLPSRSDVVINFTRVHGIDGTDPWDVSRAEAETQLQAYDTIGFLRKYVPGFERCFLVSLPHQLGVRETRHIVGGHALTRTDVLEGRDFDDEVGRGAYPLDIHDTGIGAKVLGNQVEGGGITLKHLSRSYGIPKRCLIPNGLDNVTVAGRCISATHEAAGSVRGQAVCMVTGHAAGTIAAIGALEGAGALADVPHQQVQEVLLQQGAVLKRNELIN